MELLKKHGIVIFWIILFLDCFFLFQEKYDYHPYLKPALMVVLGFYIFLNAKKKKYFRTKVLIFFGVAASFIGDVLLLNNSDSFFVAGMVAFVVAHIFYSAFFFKINPIDFKKINEVLILSIVAFVGIAYKLVQFLSEDLAKQPHFKAPIYIYMTFLGIMAVLAVHVYTNKSRRSLAINYFLPGALLFIFSDAVLALHKFHFIDVSFLQVMVMISYGYAQCLLAQGFSKYLRG